MTMLWNTGPLPEDAMGFEKDQVEVTRTARDVMERIREGLELKPDLVALAWGRPAAAAQVVTELALQLGQTQAKLAKAEKQLKKWEGIR